MLTKVLLCAFCFMMYDFLTFGFVYDRYTIEYVDNTRIVIARIKSIHVLLLLLFIDVRVRILRMRSAYIGTFHCEYFSEKILNNDMLCCDLKTKGQRSATKKKSLFFDALRKFSSSLTIN